MHWLWIIRYFISFVIYNKYERKKLKPELFQEIHDLMSECIGHYYKRNGSRLVVQAHIKIADLFLNFSKDKAALEVSENLVAAYKEVGELNQESAVYQL